MKSSPHKVQKQTGSSTFLCLARGGVIREIRFFGKEKAVQGVEQFARAAANFSGLLSEFRPVPVPVSVARSYA